MINFVENTKKVLYKGTRIILKKIIHLRTQVVLFNIVLHSSKYRKTLVTVNIWECPQLLEGRRERYLIIVATMFGREFKDRKQSICQKYEGRYSSNLLLNQS